MDMKLVQIAPISMIVGQDCVVFHEDSESGLQMATDWGGNGVLGVLLFLDARLMPWSAGVYRIVFAQR